MSMRMPEQRPEWDEIAIKKEFTQPTPARNDNSLFAQLNKVTEMSHILQDSMQSLVEKGQPLMRPVPTAGETESSDKFMGSDVAVRLHEIYERLSRLNNQINDFRSALDV